MMGKGGRWTRCEDKENVSRPELRRSSSKGGIQISTISHYNKCNRLMNSNDRCNDTKNWRPRLAEEVEGGEERKVDDNGEDGSIKMERAYSEIFSYSPEPN